MRGLVLRSFTDRTDEIVRRGSVGQIIEVPTNVNWVRAGLVRLLDQPETGDEKTAEPPESAGARPDYENMAFEMRPVQNLEMAIQPEAEKAVGLGAGRKRRKMKP